MKVSIIIPVYNVEPFIERCLLSVLNQTYENIEIILVDDKGTDNSIGTAKYIISNHPSKNKVKFIYHECNKGLSVSRNTGIKASTGEYIYLLDSDDEITFDCIEKLITPALLYNTDFVIGNYETTGSQLIMPPLNMIDGNIFSNKDILKSFRDQKWYVMAVNKLVKRELIENKQLYFKKGIIHEDELWSFMLACQASSMSVINNKTYKYHIRKDSIMGNIHNKQNESHLKKSIESKISIISLMKDYIISNPELQKETLVLNIFELKKDAFLINIIQNPYYTKKDLLMVYKDVRRLIYTNPLKSLLQSGLDFKTRIKMTHYLFPIKIGYKYYSFLSSIRIGAKHLIN